MSETVRILYIDDSPLDRELVRDALEVEGSGFVLTECGLQKEFEARLEADAYDLVLSDFNILGFEGLQVLDAVQAVSPDTPVIIVTGTGSEEIAVEAMKRGAADYVIKSASHIRRLPHTIRAVLEQRRAEEAQARTKRERDMLFERSLDMLAISGFDGNFTQLNPAWERTLGWTALELASQPYAELVHPDDREATLKAAAQLAEGGLLVSYENRYRCKDGGWRWLSWNASPWGQERLIFSVTRDITDQKAAEERIERQVNRLASLHDIDRAITTSQDLETVLNTLLDHTVEDLGVDAAVIMLYDDDNRMLEYAAGTGFSTAVREARVQMAKGYAGRAVMERRVVHVPNLLESGLDLSDEARGDDEVVEYYGAPLIAKGCLKGVLEVFDTDGLEADAEWVVFLEMLAEQAAIAIDSAQLVDSLRRTNDELALAYGATIEGWSRALDLRDKETEGHTRRVTELTLKLARSMGMSESDLVHVRRGALLHDIGKMGVPDSILLKPGPLTEDEWVEMRKHPVYAKEMLESIGYLESALDIPYCHHEKWDGSGYPRGLAGEEIPRTARIFAVVDVWDALLSDRPYRPAWTHDQARQQILTTSGTHFDPEVVDVFMRLLARTEDAEIA